MNKKVIVACSAFVLFSAAALVACGTSSSAMDSCEATCERTNHDCGDNENCAALCDALAEQAAVSHCGAPLDDFVACGSDTADLCAPGTCAAEYATFGNCVTSFCQDYPDDAICQ